MLNLSKATRRIYKSIKVKRNNFHTCYDGKIQSHSIIKSYCFAAWNDKNNPSDELLLMRKPCVLNDDVQNNHNLKRTIFSSTMRSWINTNFIIRLNHTRLVYLVFHNLHFTTYLFDFTFYFMMIIREKWMEATNGIFLLSL